MNRALPAGLLRVALAFRAFADALAIPADRSTLRGFRLVAST